MCKYVIKFAYVCIFKMKITAQIQNTLFISLCSLQQTSAIRLFADALEEFKPVFLLIISIIFRYNRSP